jgi:hypothetical protein
MRAFVAAAVAGTMFAGSAFASDPFNGQGWQRSRPPAAIAYFKLPLQASKSDKVSYGLALTAPTPRRYGNVPLLMGEAPKLLDLRFNGAIPNTLRLGEQPVWSMTPAGGVDGQRRRRAAASSGRRALELGPRPRAYRRDRVRRLHPGQKRMPRHQYDDRRLCRTCKLN